MKISGRNKTQQLGPMGPMGAPAPAESNSAAEETPRAGDSVSLSNTADLRKLQEAAHALPSVRTGVVESLRDQIEEGSYHVESDKLARKVVNDVLGESLLGTGRGLG